MSEHCASMRLERLAEAELRAAGAVREVRSERIRHLDRAAEFATLAELEGRRLDAAAREALP